MAAYDVGWDSPRFNTNSIVLDLLAAARSSLSLNYTQPLLRDWKIDNTRQQLLVTTKNREIADVSLRQTLATTTRTVRNAYWDLAYAVASLGVQQQSLDLAQESLRNTRARVEIGTTPPIDIVEAEAEVATRQEAVIVAEGAVSLTPKTRCARSSSIPSRRTSGRSHIEPTDLPPFAPTTVNVDAAVKNALEPSDRPCQIAQVDRGRRHQHPVLRNQTLPDVKAN